MKSDLYFKASNYGMLAAGYLSLLLTWQLDPLTATLYGLALAAGWFLSPQPSRFKPGWLLLNGLALLMALFFVLDYSYLSRDFRTAAIRLIFMLSLFKLYTIRSDRDYIYLLITASLQILISTTLTVNVSFLLSLVLFIAAGVATLIQLEIRQSARRLLSAAPPEQTPRLPVRPHRAGAASSSGTPSLILPATADGQTVAIAGMQYLTARHLVVTAATLTATILILAIPFFFLIPRLSRGLTIRPFDESILRAGFSSRVRLGEHGSIKPNPTVVMRVRMKGAETLPSGWKWRGVALDRYDGHTWTQSAGRRTPLSETRPAWPGGLHTFSHALLDSRTREQAIQQTILLEPINTHVVFATGYVAEIASADFTHLFKDSADGFTLARPPLSRLRYTVWSTPAPLRAASESRDGPEPFAFVNLGLPPSLDTRIKPLAIKITEEKDSPYAQAQALEAYLKSHYTYSLSLPRSSSNADPLAEFLFTSRAGHCEYFASVLAVMLRSLAIPARIVNGFRQGEYNSIGGDYVVRQSDAHSWVEAYLPESGWTEFDATPADPGWAPSPWRRWLFNIVDATELFWMDQVVNYDLRRQTVAMTEALSSWQTFESTLGRINRNWLQNIKSSWTAVSFPPPGLSRVKGAAVVILGLGVLLVIWQVVRHRPWFFRPGLGGGRSRAVGFYSLTLRLLYRYGIEKPGYQTPMEFYRSLEENRGLTSMTSMKAITETYQKARFSGDPLTPADFQQMSACIKQLRQALKSVNR